MGSDYTGCPKCFNSIYWPNADLCKKCDKGDNFLCDSCRRCVECGGNDNDSSSDESSSESSSESSDSDN